MAPSLALLIVMFTVSIPLITLGLIGRRVDRMPRCRRCGYCLLETEGRCPECGRSLARPRRVRFGRRRRRWGALGVGLLLLSVAGLDAEYRAAGTSNVWSCPSWRLLAGMALFPGRDHSIAVRRMSERWYAGELEAWERHALLALALRAWDDPTGNAALRRSSLISAAQRDKMLDADDLDTIIRGAVDALGADRARANAQNGLIVLGQLWPHSAPGVYDALESPDRQRRQLAAAVMMQHGAQTASQRLLEVAVEGLEDDDLPYANGRFTWASNAKSGTRLLISHAGRARPFLVEGMSSDDRQKRFLCAYVLGRAGRTEFIDAVAAILIEHLHDNDVPDDAKMATHALIGLGPDVVPLLLTAEPRADRQARRKIGWLLDRLEHDEEAVLDVVVVAQEARDRQVFGE